MGQDLTAALVVMLNVELVCVVLNGRHDDVIVAVADAAPRARANAIALVRAVLTGEGLRHPADRPVVLPNPLGAGLLHLTSTSVGLRGDATLTVASSRSDFPSETQRYVLRAGANQLAVAIDRWQAEMEWRRFTALVESSSDFVGVASLAGVPQYINPAGLKLVGLDSVEEAAALHLRDFVEPEAWPRVRDEFWPIVMRVGRWVGEIPFRHFTSGATIPFLVDWFRIDDPRTHEPMNVATVSRDLTDQKQSEASLRHFNEALEKRVIARTAELVEANEKLQIEETERARKDARLQELQSELFHAARLSATGQMAGALAHELSQPLAAAANFVDAARRLLESGNSPSIGLVRSRIDAGAVQIRRTSQILRRLRDFVVGREPEKHAESLTRMMEAAKTLAFADPARLGVEARFALPSDDLYVLVDRIEIQQVLVNLIRNALEAMSDSQRRILSVSAVLRDAETVEIAVADSGPGLTPEARSHLFEPFVSTKRSGMGLGLSISRTIIESHNGRLWSDPNPDGGAIFRFTLPVVSTNKESDAR